MLCDQPNSESSRAIYLNTLANANTTSCATTIPSTSASSTLLLLSFARQRPWEELMEVAWGQAEP